MYAKLIVALCVVGVARAGGLWGQAAGYGYGAPAVVAKTITPGETRYSAYSTDIVDPGTWGSPTITTINAAPAVAPIAVAPAVANIAVANIAGPALGVAPSVRVAYGGAVPSIAYGAYPGSDWW